MTKKPYAVVLDLVELYWDDAEAFVIDMLDFQPDEWQSLVLKDISEHAKVSVRSGQGVGKTALEAAIVVWYLCCRPYPRVVCTAPTRQQLMDVLWSEIDKWLSRSKVKNLLKWTKTKVYMIGHEERWFATAKTATKPENMQGFHEDYMLFLVDEASGVADKIMEAILGTLSGPENKLLMCGNPTRTSGVFYDSHHKDRKHYRTHKISSLDSPRTGKDNIQMLKEKYHEDSDVYRVRVLGEFPKAEPDVFIPLDIVEAAAMRSVYYDEDEEREIIPDAAVLQIGVDVARFGDDETVITSRVGKKTIRITAYSKKDTTETTGYVVAECRELTSQFERKCLIQIDDDGVGGGVTDQVRVAIRDLGLNAEVVGCHNGGSAENKERYENWGSESWAKVRDLFQDGEIEIPNDARLIGQLTTRKYGITSKGKIRLEPKKDMKSRGLDSPDRGDSFVLAFAEAAKPIEPRLGFFGD